MQITATIVRTAAVVALVGTIGASAAEASRSQPAGMTRIEYQALMARSEGMNARYGNAATRLSAAQFTSLYNAGGYRMDPQAFVALIERSVALNHRYGVN